MNDKKTITLLFALALASNAVADDYKASMNGEYDSVKWEKDIKEVEITARRSGTKRMAGAVNGVSIQREELFRAACCNLGESFVTNLQKHCSQFVAVVELFLDAYTHLLGFCTHWLNSCKNL